MRPYFVFSYFLCLFLTSFLIGCASHRPPVPPGVIPEPSNISAEDEEYGQAVLEQLTRQFPLDRSDARVNRVRDIVDRITAAAHADRSPWHVYVLDDTRVKNAAATRGNSVFVWRGMLEFLQSDEELAGILSHEIGHVLAGHTLPNPAEEANQMITGVAGTAAREVLSRQGGGIGLAAGLAEMVVSKSLEAFIVNPEARRKEFEADQVGIFLMADAGYNPETAVNFWKRVKDDPEFGSGGLQFLSTHPSSEERLLALEHFLPEAKQRFDQSHRKKLMPRRPNAPSPDRFDTRPPQRNYPNGSLDQSETFARRSEPRTFQGPTRKGITIYEDTYDRSPVVMDTASESEIRATCLRGEYAHVRQPAYGYIRLTDLKNPQEIQDHTPKCE